MRRIWLRGKRGEGKFTKVDNEDYQVCMKFKWYLNPLKRRNMSNLKMVMLVNALIEITLIVGLVFLIYNRLISPWWLLLVSFTGI